MNAYRGNPKSERSPAPKEEATAVTDCFFERNFYYGTRRSYCVVRASECRTIWSYLSLRISSLSRWLPWTGNYGLGRREKEMKKGRFADRYANYIRENPRFCSFASLFFPAYLIWVVVTHAF